MTKSSVSILVCVGLIVSGCAGSGARFQNRYGPNPVMALSDVEEVASRQAGILNILAKNALGGAPAAGDPPTVWYEVVQYGFNFVDEKCDSYLQGIFILDRERGRLKSSLVLLDKTTGAILSAADASKASIEIVAQAFGFSQGITDIVANSYLFSITPSLIYKNVSDARFAYRAKTEADRLQIASGGIAYSRIRGYLELCFPQTIESRIEASIAQTTAKPAEKPPTKPPTSASASEVPPQIETVPQQ